MIKLDIFQCVSYGYVFTFLAICSIDYQRSLKESPKIPFDAKKTPIQGLLKSLPGEVELKSPPKPRRTPLHINKTASSSKQRKSKQAKSAKRPRAVDFF